MSDTIAATNSPKLVFHQPQPLSNVHLSTNNSGIDATENIQGVFKSQESHPKSIQSQFSQNSSTHIKRLADFFASPTSDDTMRTTSYLKPRPGLKLAAVLVVIFERADSLHVILTTRAKGLRTHGGQTSLPGGKMEEGDEDVIVTALREANEEIALPIDSDNLEVLGTLEPHPFHGLTVVPVVAVLTDPTIVGQLKPGEGEVDHIFSHPLQAILDPELAPSLSESEKLVEHGCENWPHENRYHHYQDHIVEELGGISYRLHCFQTSATQITGFTSDVLIRTAELLYDQSPTYKRHALGQIKSFEKMLAIANAHRPKDSRQ